MRWLKPGLIGTIASIGAAGWREHLRLKVEDVKKDISCKWKQEKKKENKRVTSDKIDTGPAWKGKKVCIMMQIKLTKEDIAITNIYTLLED